MRAFSRVKDYGTITAQVKCVEDGGQKSTRGWGLERDTTLVGFGNSRGTLASIRSAAGDVAMLVLQGPIGIRVLWRRRRSQGTDTARWRRQARSRRPADLLGSKVIGYDPPPDRHQVSTRR